MKNSNRSLSAKRRYWRERLAVAKRSVNIDGFRFPTGSVLPHRKLSQRALDALIDWRGAAWQTRTGRTYPKATKLPEPEKPLPQIKAQIVEDNDVVESWLMTEAAILRLCDGHAGRANDVLMGDERVRELYKRATREVCVRVAKIFKRPSVDPAFAWEYIKGRKQAA